MRSMFAILRVTDVKYFDRQLLRVKAIFISFRSAFTLNNTFLNKFVVSQLNEIDQQLLKCTA